MNNQDSTATPTNSATTTNQQEIETSRSFRIVERKSFSIAPAGTFNATLRGLSFIGRYTKEFTKNNITTSKVYEMVGLAYVFTDLNTGEQSEIFTECVLSYVPDSRLHGHIMALAPEFKEGDTLQNLVGKPAKITIQHSTRTNPTTGDNRTYANITQVAVADKNAKIQPVAKEHLFYFDIKTDMAKIADLNSKHTWLIQNKSHEHGGGAPSTTSTPNTSGQAPQQQEQPPVHEYAPA